MGKGERERERLREERIAAQEGAERSDRKRLILGYAVVSTVVIAAMVLIVVLASGGGDDNGGGGNAHINVNQEMGSTNGIPPDEREGIPPPPPKILNLQKAADRAGCFVRLKLKDEGHTHIPQNSPPPNYDTDPPTSGDHVEPPYQQADGAYAAMPDDIDVVHSLEHGRMAIQYFPDLKPSIQLRLKGLYDTMYGATLLFPNTEMQYAIAATTWTNMLVCPGWNGAATLDAIRAFGKETWGKYGGEPVEAFTFTGPTPAEPEEPGSDSDE